MSILTHLSTIPPRHKAPPGAFNVKYQVTKRYLADIETARTQGYSWDQIKRAVMEEAKQDGIWSDKLKCWDLGSVYKAVKKNGA